MHSFKLSPSQTDQHISLTQQRWQFQQQRRKQIHERQADTDRQAGRQTGKQTGRQTDRSTAGQTRMQAFTDRWMGSRADLEGKEADVCRRLHAAEPLWQSPEGTTSCGHACACQGSAQLPLQPRAAPRCPLLPAPLALLPSPDFFVTEYVQTSGIRTYML